LLSLALFTTQFFGFSSSKEKQRKNMLQFPEAIFLTHHHRNLPPFYFMGEFKKKIEEKKKKSLTLPFRRA
jgi:hypothetical protein